ncbi:MAG: hypothetical protein JWP79_2598 [Polaromonas sp.]|jgi:hypothetical protein|nr:hypothetical protein [Polaromonas sp.]MDB5938017.1 hypothetical protein [Polaromonas sp.]
MMMKQMMQKAKSRFFEPDEVSRPAALRIASPIDRGFSNRPVMLNRLSAEQQRIQLLETQVQQLRADVARWKNSSLGFAHEMRDLLND